MPADSLRPVRTVALVGVGLMGGSLGLALRARRPDLHVVGFDADPASLRRALERGAIHRAAPGLDVAVAQADLVVLALPVRALLDALPAVATAAQPGTRVTDLGSVKRIVLETAEQTLPPEVPFCGGHPMGGAEHAGIEHARADLYEGVPWALCPPMHLPMATFGAVWAPLQALVEAVGARPVLVDAASHDDAVAAISHLPQVLSVALAPAAEGRLAATLAGRGFRDTTRLADSPFALWREILEANRKPVLRALAAFEHRLGEVRRALEDEDWAAVEHAFVRARTARAGLPPGPPLRGR